MLVLPLRACVDCDLARALADWLDDPAAEARFAPARPQLRLVLPKPTFGSAACRADLARLQALRRGLGEACGAAGTAAHAAALAKGALGDAHEYHACLLACERRGFPAQDPDDDDVDDDVGTADHRRSCGLRLAWRGAWPPHATETHGSLVWDRAGAAFNAAALEARAAAQASVTDRDACRLAVGHCQRAAGVLGVLRELVANEDYATVDFADGHLQFWIAYLTAAGQDFVYRMAALGDAAAQEKHGMLARLAQSAHSLYNAALQAAQDPRLQSELPAESAAWGAHCKAASMLFAARAAFHAAAAHRRAAEWGPEIARLRECLRRLEACRDFLRTLPPDGAAATTTNAQRECRALLPVVEDRLLEADRDNLKVYHQQIPREMPDIEAAQMAKCEPGMPDAMLEPQRLMFEGL